MAIASQQEPTNPPSTSSARTTVFRVLVVIVALLLGVIGKECARDIFRVSRTPNVRSQSLLASLASKQNASLPMMLDKDTEFFSVGALEGVIIYNYRLVSLDAANIDVTAFVAALTPQLQKAACSNPAIRGNILNKGVAMRYTYSDRNRIHIASIDVVSASCGP